MLKQLISLSVLSIFLFSNCTKENTTPEVNLNEPLYYLDNLLVDESNFPMDDESIYLGITKRPNTLAEENIPQFNAFTTKDAYIKWGEKNNYLVKMQLEIEEHLSTYAEVNGYIDRFEKSGVVAQSYLDYEKEYIRLAKINYGIQHDSRASALLRNTCGQVNDYWIFDTQPWLPSAHNNQISAVNVFQVFAFHSIYNRTFYRSNLGTYWDFGGNMHCWIGWFARFDNRMSSGMFL